ncbi:MAG: Maf family protein [bacterium]
MDNSDREGNNRLVLASASPRRAELLRQIGVRFSVQPVDISEDVSDTETPTEAVTRLAREKAQAGLVLQSDAKSVVIGSDTIVVHSGRIMGKPTNRADVLTMLGELSGRTHRVLTAVAVESAAHSRSICVTTDVTFRAISTAEAERYCDTGEPMDKAGAYGIQGFGAVFVASISGSYSAVVGLPLYETASLLDEFGIPRWQ